MSSRSLTAGQEYFDKAELLLNYDYGSSKLVTVQALLLMAYREIGTGAMSASWLFTGMGAFLLSYLWRIARRTSRLSRCVCPQQFAWLRIWDSFEMLRSGAVLPNPFSGSVCRSFSCRFLPVQRFSHEEKQTRKRVWWGCIILDRYTASYIGRPGTIHEVRP